MQIKTGSGGPQVTNKMNHRAIIILLFQECTLQTLCFANKYVAFYSCITFTFLHLKTLEHFFHFLFFLYFSKVSHLIFSSFCDKFLTLVDLSVRMLLPFNYLIDLNHIVRNGSLKPGPCNFFLKYSYPARLQLPLILSLQC